MMRTVATVSATRGQSGAKRRFATGVEPGMRALRRESRLDRRREKREALDRGKTDDAKSLAM